MSRRRRRQRSITTAGADVTHPEHSSIKAHAKAVKAGLRELEKSGGPASSKKALKAYVLRARGISLLVSPFIDVEAVLWEGLGVDDKEPDDDGAFYSDEFLQIDRAMPGYLHNLLRQIYKGDRSREDDDQDIEEEYDEVEGKKLVGRFISLLDESFKSGRTDCTANLKKYVPLYLTKARTLSRPLAAPSAKSLRGFNHVDFGAAIVGIKYRDEYRANPELYCSEVNNGTRSHVYDSLPSFLFADEIFYDDQTPENGLGTGHLLERCLRLELTGDSTSLGGKRTSGKASKAWMWDVHEVTPEIVASIGAQIYIATSSMVEFDSKDEKFNVFRLHQSLLRIFRSSDDWTQETLKRLTSAVSELSVAPKKRKRAMLDDDDSENIPDPADVIFSQRKERAAAAEAEQRKQQDALKKAEERKRLEVRKARERQERDRQEQERREEKRREEERREQECWEQELREQELLEQERQRRERQERARQERERQERERQKQRSVNTRAEARRSLSARSLSARQGSFARRTSLSYRGGPTLQPVASNAQERRKQADRLFFGPSARSQSSNRQLNTRDDSDMYASDHDNDLAPPKGVNKIRDLLDRENRMEERQRSVEETQCITPPIHKPSNRTTAALTPFRPGSQSGAGRLPPKTRKATSARPTSRELRPRRSTRASTAAQK